MLDMIDPEPLDEYALAGLRAQPIHPDDVELDSWLQRAKAAERERRNAEDRANASDLVREKWQARAEAAEQRIEELEEALREIAKPFSSFDPKPQAIARAALSASESGEA